MQYRTDTKRDLRQIANALGVVNILEGTVRRAANHVRITTELIDAINDRTIWSEIYDRDLSDIFAIQSEVAQTIAHKLAATLSPEEKKNIEAIPTENLEAYDLYLQAKERRNYAGVFPLLTGYEKPMREAIDLLDRAIRLDPNFTLAYCESAGVHDELYRAYDPTAMRRALGDSAIKHALLLQPSLPDVHLRYANHLYMGYRDYERARVQLAIARRDMPNSPEAAVLQAFMHRRQGNFEKAIQDFNEAISLDPRNPMTELPNTLSMMREFSAAERTFDRAIALAPDHPILKVLKAYLVTYQKSGSVVAMKAALAELPESMANDRDVLTWHLFCALNERDWQQATALVEKLKDGDDEGAFAYMQVPVPAGCYLVLIARLQGSQPNANFGVVAARAQLDQRVRMAQGDGVARLLTQLAVVDALLGKDQDAVVEAKRAVEMLPISKDAVDGPGIAQNLAVVYAWTNELDLAFETLAPLA
jgi:tetratricopeptide (TPR) repeat protein